MLSHFTIAGALQITRVTAAGDFVQSYDVNAAVQGSGLVGGTFYSSCVRVVPATNPGAAEKGSQMELTVVSRVYLGPLLETNS